ATIIPSVTWLHYKPHVLSFRSDLAETQCGAIFGFVGGFIAMVIATRFDSPKPLSELKGLVVGLQERDVQTTTRVAWYRSPVLLGAGALLLCALLYLFIAVV